MQHRFDLAKVASLGIVQEILGVLSMQSQSELAKLTPKVSL